MKKLSWTIFIISILLGGCWWFLQEVKGAQIQKYVCMEVLASDFTEAKKGVRKTLKKYYGDKELFRKAKFVKPANWSEMSEAEKYTYKTNYIATNDDVNIWIDSGWMDATDKDDTNIVKKFYCNSDLNLSRAGFAVDTNFIQILLDSTTNKAESFKAGLFDDEQQALNYWNTKLVE